MSREQTKRNYYGNDDDKRRLRNSAYVNGNLAGNLAVQPERVPDIERQPQRKPQVEERPLIGIRRGIDFIAMAMLTIALGIAAFTTIGYLSVSAKSVQLDKSLSALSTEYESISSSNDNKMAEIADSINLKDVYEVAVGKLGMVYPNENQVITYSYDGDGYVRQYSSIPEATLTADTSVLSVIERLLSD